MIVSSRLPAGEIYLRFRVTSGQGRTARVAPDLRLRDGRLSRLLGLLLLAEGTQRRRVRLQPDTAHQSGRVHQHVLAGLRAHTRRDDGRTVQPGRQGTGAGRGVRDRVPVGVRRGQDVPEPLGLVQPRRDVLDIRRLLHTGHSVRVVLGTGDEEQVAAGDPKRTERQEEAEKPQHQPLSTNGNVVQQERSDCLIRQYYNKCSSSVCICLTNGLGP